MNDWYIFDKTGIIEVSGLSQKDAFELVDDLRACEPESGWQCAEDKPENGDVEEA
jgi:hypothetical protein